MKFEKFEDILAWQGSRIVIKQIYEIFKDHLDYGFKNQILRTSISIGNNIAEWFERKTNNEFKQFLYIAKWSSAELRSMLYNALDVWYIDKETFDELFEKTTIIAKQLSNLIQTL